MSEHDHSMYYVWRKYLSKNEKILVISGVCVFFFLICYLSVFIDRLGVHNVLIVSDDKIYFVETINFNR